MPQRRSEAKPERCRKNQKLSCNEQATAWALMSLAELARSKTILMALRLAVPLRDSCFSTKALIDDSVESSSESLTGWRCWRAPVWWGFATVSAKGGGRHSWPQGVEALNDGLTFPTLFRTDMVLGEPLLVGEESAGLSVAAEYTTMVSLLSQRRNSRPSLLGIGLYLVLPINVAITELWWRVLELARRS